MNKTTEIQFDGWWWEEENRLGSLASLITDWTVKAIVKDVSKRAFLSGYDYGVVMSRKEQNGSSETNG